MSNPTQYPYAPSHPLFRYHECRNPYFKKVDTLFPIALKNHAPEELKGRWKESILGEKAKSTSRLTVEIGPGTGEFLIDSAKSSPENAFVGIEKKYKQVYKISKKATNEGLSNIRFLRAYAERLPYLFEKKEIDRLFVLFPDPWPKAKHHKNRLLQTEFLSLVHALIKPNGELMIRTDHAGYYEWIVDALQKIPRLWEISDQTPDLYGQEFFAKSPVLSIPQTLFEGIWRREGKKISALALIRKPD